MNEGKDNIIATKSYSFAPKVIDIYKYLVSEKKEFVMCKQLLRCGTSINANVQEAIASESIKDVIHKSVIPLKEEREILYWLRLLKDRNYMFDFQAIESSNPCEELIRIPESIILTTKKWYFQNIHNS